MKEWKISFSRNTWTCQIRHPLDDRWHMPAMPLHEQFKTAQVHGRRPDQTTSALCAADQQVYYFASQASMRMPIVAPLLQVKRAFCSSACPHPPPPPRPILGYCPWFLCHISLVALHLYVLHNQLHHYLGFNRMHFRASLYLDLLLTYHKPCGRPCILEGKVPGENTRFFIQGVVAKIMGRCIWHQCCMFNNNNCGLYKGKDYPKAFAMNGTGAWKI